MNLAWDLFKLICNFPIRKTLFNTLKEQHEKEETQNEKKPGIKPFCDTRWTVRTGFFSSKLGNYDMFLEILDEIGRSKQGEYNIRAKGHLALMHKFHAYFAFILAC